MVRAFVGLSTMTSVWATGRGVTGSFFIAPAAGAWKTVAVRTPSTPAEVATVAPTQAQHHVAVLPLAAATAAEASAAIAAGLSTGSLNLSLHAAAIAPDAAHALRKTIYGINGDTHAKESVESGGERGGEMRVRRNLCREDLKVYIPGEGLENFR